MAMAGELQSKTRRDGCGLVGRDDHVARKDRQLIRLADSKSELVLVTPQVYEGGIVRPQLNGGR